MIKYKYDEDKKIIRFTLDELIALAPPLSPEIIEKLGDWSAKDRKLIRQFPGADPEYDRREDAKYTTPRRRQNLRASLVSLLYTARSHWSRDVFTADGWRSQTRLQFREWLPDYLNRETWWWGSCLQDGVSISDAGNLLLAACGLPSVCFEGPKNTMAGSGTALGSSSADEEIWV